MTTKRVSKREAASKAAADARTAEQVRAILGDPKTPSSVAEKLRGLINRVGGATDAPPPETGDFYAHTFAYGSESLRLGEVARLEAKEAHEAAEQIARIAERHEPKEYKVARRCAEIYAVLSGDAASFFVEHVDAVLEGNEDGLMPNPDSKYFAPLFVESMRERGPRDRRVRELLALIRRVDEGADLKQLHDEADRAWEEYAAKRQPKNARLVDRLSAILRDPVKGGEVSERIGELLNALTTDTGTDDLHPDIFPTLAGVLIREARTLLRAAPAGDLRHLRARLRELESIAGE